MQDSSDNVASKSGKIGYSERKVCFLSHLNSLIFWFVDSLNTFRSHHGALIFQAFTGSVIERTHDLQSDQPAKSTSTNQVG